MTLWNKPQSTNRRGIAMTQSGLDRLHADERNESSQVGQEIRPQVEDAPPVSSLLSEPTPAKI